MAEQARPAEVALHARSSSRVEMSVLQQDPNDAVVDSGYSRARSNGTSHLTAAPAMGLKDRCGQEASRCMDEETFEKLWKGYEPDLFGIAMQLYWGNRSDAEDLVQETAMKLSRHRQQLDERYNVHAYMRTVLRRTFVDQFRYRRRRPQVSLEALSPGDDGASFDPIDPNATAEVTFGTTPRAGVTDNLSDDQCRALRLRAAGTEYRDIAADLECEESQVIELLERAVSAVGEQIRDLVRELTGDVPEDMNGDQLVTLALTELYGFPDKQVAKILGCETGTVASRKNRIKQKLAEALSDVGAERGYQTSMGRDGGSNE